MNDQLDPFADNNDDSDNDFDNICDIFGANAEDQDARGVKKWLAVNGG